MIREDTATTLQGDGLSAPYDHGHLGFSRLWFSLTRPGHPASHRNLAPPRVLAQPPGFFVRVSPLSLIA